MAKIASMMRELKQLECAWPFLDPVPVDLVPGYAEKIAVPMDLGDGGKSDELRDGAGCGGGGGGGPTSTPNVVLSDFQISLNDGTGAFDSSFKIAGLGAEHIAGAADLDADGDVDLVAGRVVYYPREPITGPVHPPVGTSGRVSVGSAANAKPSDR